MIRTILTLASIIGVIILVLVGVSVYERSTDFVAPAAVTEYQNTSHGYTLSYPGTLSVLEYTPDTIAIGHLSNEGIDAVANVQVVMVSGESGESFIDAATRTLKGLCAVEGLETSFTCTGVERSKPFITRSGAVGYEAYLTGTRTTHATGNTESVSHGPYYGFLLDGSATAATILIVHAPLTKSLEEADARIITSIAQSVAFSKPTQDQETIEEYVARNISNLSPEPEVLGGTYFVTAIEANNGTGIVSYEDGHNAYTADFTYSLSASGIRIDTFVIRAQ